MNSIRQLTLDWPHAPSFAREDFLPAPANRDALEAVDRWPDWASPMMLLVGPEGAGKTHLATVWATAAGALALRAETLNEASLEAAAGSGALLIEDADRVGEGEARLFHLVNSALQSNAWLLMTARAPPDAWGVRTPDLLSRLRLAPVLRLAAPDDELTERVLFKLFSDRQLQVEPHVIAYIGLRIERSLGAARNLVALLDRESLARGRRVTRAMASEILREAPPEGESP